MAEDGGGFLNAGYVIDNCAISAVLFKCQYIKIKTVRLLQEVSGSNFTLSKPRDTFIGHNTKSPIPFTFKEINRNCKREREINLLLHYSTIHTLLSSFGYHVDGGESNPQIILRVYRSDDVDVGTVLAMERGIR